MIRPVTLKDLFQLEILRCKLIFILLNVGKDLLRTESKSPSEPACNRPSNKGLGALVGLYCLEGTRVAAIAFSLMGTCFFHPIIPFDMG